MPFFVLLLSVVLSGIVHAQSVTEPLEAFEKARALYLKDQTGAALEVLKKTEHGSWAAAQQALKYFTMATWAEELGQWKEVQEFLLQSQKLDSGKAAYVHYLLGQSYLQTGDQKKATAHFKKGLSHKPPQNIKLEIRLELGDIAIAKHHYKTAYRHLAYLERKWRNTYRHPEVLWRLMKVEMALKRKWRACRWARKIYSRYPAHPLIFDWGIDLQAARFEGKKLNCVASPYDQKRRIRRLQWAGESERARKEIETLQSRAKGSALYDVDLLLAKYLTNEGYVDEAIKVLIKHYNKKNNSFKYLMLLGKAASRASEYQTAVGAYFRAHKEHPKSRSGRQALFRAAFLSYQFQDYDGAARKFELFRKLYKRSGLRRDAQWHLAWIRYLKGDYEGAVTGFKSILRQRQRHKRLWRKYPAEKIKYWLAMSYLRQHKYKLARPLFQELMGDRLMGYYSIVAQNRYNSIPGIEPVYSLAVYDRDLASLKSNPEKIEMPAVVLPQGQAAEVSEENESEETLGLTALEEPVETEESAGEKSEAAASEGEEEGGGDVIEEDEEVAEVTTFSDPKLAKRFEQANDFINTGLYDWAKWELFEIERRTRNPDYLKMLMKSYERINSFNRSSYLSEIYFSSQRREHGIYGVRYLWEYAYPRAFRNIVEKNAKEFGVPPEFIWSIMRAESRFKPDVISPVGARGLMQIMPYTARQLARLLSDPTYQERSLIEPKVNVRLGTRYLQRLLKKFEGQVPLAAAGYNAGPHRVESWLSSFGNLDMDEFIEHIPFIETRNYVKKVVRHYGIYRDLYNTEAKPMAWLSKSIPVKITGRPSPRETWELLE